MSNLGNPFRNKKGISLVEVVIAMAIVTIVTITTLSIIYSSTLATQKASHRTAAQYFAMDILEAFKMAENEQQFIRAVEYRGGYTQRSNEEDKYIFVLEQSNYKALVTVDYPAVDRPSLSVVITDNSGEAVAQIDDFKKGV